jgi:hypothetical protein
VIAGVVIKLLLGVIARVVTRVIARVVIRVIARFVRTARVVMNEIMRLLGVFTMIIRAVITNLNVRHEAGKAVSRRGTFKPKIQVKRHGFSSQ